MIAISLSNDLSSPTLFIIKSLSFQVSVILIASCIVCIYKQTTLTIKLVLALSCFILCINVISALPYIQPNKQDNKSITNNILVGTFSAMTRTRNAEDIKKLVLDYKPDILCLQEVLKEDIISIGARYPYSLNEHNATFATFSHYRLEHISTNSTLQFSKVYIDAHKPTILINAHMPRQYLTKNYFEIAWKHIFKILTETYPENKAILCGDLNMTPYHSMYSIALNTLNLQDNHKESGKGFGFTFPSSNRKTSLFGTQIRIDYILSRGYSSSATYSAFISKLSDHKAVFTHLKTEKM